MQQVRRLTSWLASSTVPFEVIAAGLVGAMLGGAVVVVSDEGTRMIAILVGAVAGALFVLYTGQLKRILILAMMIDASSMFDVNIPCERTFRAMTCGYNFSLMLICLVILYALWLMELRSKRVFQFGVRKIDLDPLSKISLVWMATVVLSFVASKEIRFSFYQLWMLFAVMLMFFYLTNNLRTRYDIMLVLFGLAMGLTLQVGIMQLQNIGLLTDATGELNASRISGTLHSPNIAGSYLAQSILLFIPLLLFKWKSNYTLFALMLLLMLATQSLVATESRGAWSAVALGAVFMVVLGVRERWINVSLLIKGAIVLALLAGAFSGPIIERLTADDNGSADARAPLAEIALNMIRANPIVGVGTNQYGVALNYYIGLQQYGAWLNIVHNGWLLVWSEQGTLGFAAFLAFRLMTVWQCWRLIRSGDKFYGLLGLGITASIIGASLHMMGEIYGGRFYYVMFWLQGAVVTAAVRLALPAKSPAPTAVIEQPPRKLPSYRVRPAPSGD